MAKRGPKGPTSTSFKKGVCANPKGRPPILLPEVTALVAKEKNAIKVLIVKTLSMEKSEFEACCQADHKHSMTEEVLYRCIERMGNDGNMEAFRKLLEIVVGKLPEDKDPFDMNSDEKMIVLEYRRRMEAERVRLAEPVSTKPD